MPTSPILRAAPNTLEAIQEALRRHGARLHPPYKPTRGDDPRREASRLIWMRHHEARSLWARLGERTLFAEDVGPTERDLLHALAAAGMAHEDDGAFEPVRSAEAHTFVMGGWLELLAGLALVDAGLQSVIHGQVVAWEPGFGAPEAFNEIDAAGLLSGRLVLISCKALRFDVLAVRDGEDRLFDALQEVSYWNDHFAGGNGVAMLVTTADLFDESRGRPRRATLQRRAEAMKVRLVSPDRGARSLEKAVLNALRDSVPETPSRT